MATSPTPDYETLRNWTRATPQPRHAPAGLALMVRQGLATWLQVREDVPLAPSLQSTTPLAPTLADGAGPQDRRALITVLATMVEHTQQEVAR